MSESTVLSYLDSYTALVSCHYLVTGYVSDLVTLSRLCIWFGDSVLVCLQLFGGSDLSYLVALSRIRISFGDSVPTCHQLFGSSDLSYLVALSRIRILFRDSDTRICIVISDSNPVTYSIL